MEDVKIIEEFLRIRFSGYGDGYGYGYGYGSGSGSGDGSGDGYGSGSGDGDGDGDGSGDGSGYGSGYGDGYGYGDGSGYGYGYGSGDGDGDGSGYGLKAFCGERVWYVDGVPTLIDQVRGNIANGRIVKDDFTTDFCYIARVDDFWAHGMTIHKAVADATAKALEDMPIEGRIAKFKAEFPSLATKAKCSDFYKWHHILTGSCTMGRNQFIKEHNLDMDRLYTVEYFLNITAGFYGGNIIKQLKESYRNVLN